MRKISHRQGTLSASDDGYRQDLTTWGVPAIGKDHAFACAVSIPAAKSTWPAGVDTRRGDRARPSRSRSWIRSTVGVLAAGAGVAAAGYAAYASVTWYRYGHVPRTEADERDELLDRFMPDYEVVERHSIRVAAPAALTLAAAREQDLLRLPLVRAIFKAREMAMGAAPDDRARPQELLAEMLSLGWGVLAEAPGREIVVGAVTKPWEPNVTFHSLPPEEFAAFCQPGFVKIAWTLRADPIAPNSSTFRTETRALATDPIGRILFRRYWAFASPGIALIRWLSLRPLRREAERRACTEFIDEPHRRTGPSSRSPSP